MTRSLGFFRQFKGADTVLLSISQDEARDLARELQNFAASSMPAMPIVANSVPGHETKLEAVREAQPAAGTSAFHWLCGPRQVGDILSKMTSLANASEGHQYFELLGSEVQLMVSVGEYRA